MCCRTNQFETFWICLEKIHANWWHEDEKEQVKKTQEDEYLAPKEWKPQQGW